LARVDEAETVATGEALMAIEHGHAATAARAGALKPRASPAHVAGGVNDKNDLAPHVFVVFVKPATVGDLETIAQRADSDLCHGFSVLVPYPIKGMTRPEEPVALPSPDVDGSEPGSQGLGWKAPSAAVSMRSHPVLHFEIN
jgi:hypothetical protein